MSDQPSDTDIREIHERLDRIEQRQAPKYDPPFYREFGCSSPCWLCWRLSGRQSPGSSSPIRLRAVVKGCETALIYLPMLEVRVPLPNLR